MIYWGCSSLIRRQHRADTYDIGRPEPVRGCELSALAAGFYRGYSKRRRGLSALGLSIAWEIVALHKGSLHVEDAVGGGAVFILSLLTV